jgi:hypothetical protein
MRMYVEAHLRFAELFEVDPEEAINNIDRTFEMKLEAFHALYDISKALFPYFDHGDTALLIIVRNALHHRDHPLFRSLNRHLHLEGGRERWLGASLLLASHPTLHGAPIRMSHHITLNDIEARLDPSHASPYFDKSVRAEKAALRLMAIEAQLALPVIRKRGLEDGYPKDQTYLDLMPIFVSAVCKVFKAMSVAGIDFKGFDAETYMIPFTSELEVDLVNPEFKLLKL